MKTESGNVFSDDGVKITLSELLNKIPDNNWKWQMFEFEGVGSAPNGMEMSVFEELVVSEKYGFKFTWEELKEFSKEISDIKHCVLVAVDKLVEYNSLEDNDLLAFVGVFDSTDWDIKIY